MDYRFRVWITKDEKKVFGEGPWRLLKKVEEMGSIRQAAMSMEMSYGKAWKIIKNIEKELDCTFLEKSIGGEKGGGSKLTKEAKEFMKRYEVLKNNVDQKLQEEMELFLKN